jgi:hypothetical protein
MLEHLPVNVLLLTFLLGLGWVINDDAKDPVQPVFAFADPAIVESSGLVAQDGLVYTTNDSGDTGRVFAVDPASGETVGVTRWAAEPTDVEALAPGGPGRVWVGDIGDNSASRDRIEVSRVPVGRGDRTVRVPSYALTYPDGPENAETLLADPRDGRLYVATKGVFGGRLYAAPRTLSASGTNRLRPVGDVLAIATDGAFLPDGRHLVLRDYSDAVVYTFPDLEKVGSFALPYQEQGEGLAATASDELLTSSEGRGSDVFRVRLPADVRAALAPRPPLPPVTQRASPPPTTYSREGRELPEALSQQRSAWPWFLTGWIAVGGLVLLLRSMRRR